MILERVFLAGAGFSASLGSFLMAQSLPISIDPVEIIGGSILTAVGLVALRMVLTASKHARDVSDGIEAGLQRRVIDLEADLAAERKRSARLIVAYDRERRLRVALESAGAGKGRGVIGFGENLVTWDDRIDLEEEIHESGD